MSYSLSCSGLKKLSLDFRTVASRLLRTDFEDGMDNLRRFLEFVDGEPVLSGFIENNSGEVFDVETAYRTRRPRDRYPVPTSPAGEIAFTYQLLKYAACQSGGDYFMLADGYGTGTKLQAHVDEFNHRVVLPFVTHITNYLQSLMIDGGWDESARTTVTVTGNGNRLNVAQDNSSVTVTYHDGWQDVDAAADQLLAALSRETEASKEQVDLAKEVAEYAKEESRSATPNKSRLARFVDGATKAVSAAKFGAETIVALNALAQLVRSISG